MHSVLIGEFRFVCFQKFAGGNDKERCAYVDSLKYTLAIYFPPYVPFVFWCGGIPEMSAS